MGSRERGAVVALVGVLVLLAFLAYFPFRWDPPRLVANDVVRTSEGTLAFGVANRARTPGTPSWLQDVRASGRFTAVLEARPRVPQRDREVSIMMLAADYWHTDFCLGQDGSDLLLWLRRPGADAVGAPPFVVRDAFADGRSTRVQVDVAGDTLTVGVDGTTRLREAVPAGSLRTWEGGRLVLGDEVDGGRGWQGELLRAEVTTVGHTVDYVTPGALDVPRRYLYLPDHLAPFQPASPVEWLVTAFHLVSFVPVGMLVVCARRPRLRPLPAGGVALGIAVALAAGKLLFADRHAAVADLVAEVLGALAGAYAVTRWGARRRR